MINFPMNDQSFAKLKGMGVGLKILEMVEEFYLFRSFWGGRGKVLKNFWSLMYRK